MYLPGPLSNAALFTHPFPNQSEEALAADTRQPPLEADNQGCRLTDSLGGSTNAAHMTLPGHEAPLGVYIPETVSNAVSDTDSSARPTSPPPPMSSQMLYSVLSPRKRRIREQQRWVHRNVEGAGERGEDGHVYVSLMREEHIRNAAAVSAAAELTRTEQGVAVPGTDMVDGDAATHVGFDDVPVSNGGTIREYVYSARGAKRGRPDGQDLPISHC